MNIEDLRRKYIDIIFNLFYIKENLFFIRKKPAINSLKGNMKEIKSENIEWIC
jgi:hypothetical protein